MRRYKHTVQPSFVSEPSPFDVSSLHWQPQGFNSTVGLTVEQQCPAPSMLHCWLHVKHVVYTHTANDPFLMTKTRQWRADYQHGLSLTYKDKTTMQFTKLCQDLLMFAEERGGKIMKWLFTVNAAVPTQPEVTRRQQGLGEKMRRDVEDCCETCEGASVS